MTSAAEIQFRFEVFPLLHYLREIFENCVVIADVGLYFFRC